jgi:hypothetical protein
MKMKVYIVVSYTKDYDAYGNQIDVTEILNVYNDLGAAVEFTMANKGQHKFLDIQHRTMVTN